MVSGTVRLRLPSAMLSPLLVGIDDDTPPKLVKLETAVPSSAIVDLSVPGSLVEPCGKGGPYNPPTTSEPPNPL